MPDEVVLIDDPTPANIAAWTAMLRRDVAQCFRPWMCKDCAMKRGMIALLEDYCASLLPLQDHPVNLRGEKADA